MRNTLLLLCEDVTVDNKTNQWSFFKHIERVSLVVPKGKLEEQRNISIKGRFNIVSFWEVGQSKEVETKYQLVDAEGDVLLDTPPYKMEAKEGSSNLKQRLVLDQIIVRGNGTYYLKLFKKGEGGFITESILSIDVVIKEGDEDGKKIEEGITPTRTQIL